MYGRMLEEVIVIVTSFNRIPHSYLLYKKIKDKKTKKQEERRL